MGPGATHCPRRSRFDRLAAGIELRSTTDRQAHRGRSSCALRSERSFFSPAPWRAAWACWTRAVRSACPSVSFSKIRWRSCWRSSIPTILATIGFAWWFRASNTRATYRPDWAFSGQLELIVWAIPALVITFLGGIAWFGSHTLDPYRAAGVDAEADRDRGRLARLEMAVHLPGRGRRDRQPARRPRRARRCISG